MVDIAPEDELYRRLAPDHINPDGTVNSAAFKTRGKPDNQISVDLARLTDPQTSLSRGRPGFKLGSLLAEVPMSEGFQVIHRPVPDNSAHAQIEGENSRAKCRILARATRVLQF